MVDRPKRFGFGGAGRSSSYGWAPKVARGEITAAYPIDVVAIEKAKRNYCNPDKRSLMAQPTGKGAWDLLEGEVAYKLPGSYGVLTAINGQDAQFVESLGDEPDIVRDLMELICQPIGFVRQDAKMSGNRPQVTLRVGGTCPAGNAGKTNVPEHIAPSFGDAVAYVPPDLEQPVQFGNPASGVPEGKVLLQSRAVNKMANAKRMMRVIGFGSHHPERFKRALRDYRGLRNSWLRAGEVIHESYVVGALMLIDLLLSTGKLGVTAGATELLDADGNEQDSERTTAIIAELLGVLEPREAFNNLDTDLVKKGEWRDIQYRMRQRILPVADPESDKYNLANEFAYFWDPVNKRGVSTARTNGKPNRTQLGVLLEKSLSHVPKVFAAYSVCTWQERRVTLGVALTTPSQKETGIFDLLVTPGGGMSAITV